MIQEFKNVLWKNSRSTKKFQKLYLLYKCILFRFSSFKKQKKTQTGISSVNFKSTDAGRNSEPKSQ